VVVSKLDDGGLVAHGGPHVFVSDLETLVIDSDDRHHLGRALRLRDGDQLTASDGVGAWRSCLFRSGDGEPLGAAGEIVVTAAPRPRLTICFALVKGSKPELVVQKLTELGIDRIVPFTAARSVVRWDQTKAQRNAERLRRVAREAAMQSHRAWLPEVESPPCFSTVAAMPGAVRADMNGAPLSAAGDAADINAAGIHTVLIGPEGGWDEGERAAVPRTVALGAHVLRAETAAIAAATLLASRRI